MGAARSSPHTRDLEDVVAWLAQQMAKTPITQLLRIGWDTVGRIVERVAADHLDETRLDGLVAIGVDEISYRRGALPHQRRRPRQRRDRVVLTRSQRRHIAGVLQ
jgi:pimeloyl-ACP methyl ester carboxylesterase